MCNTTLINIKVYNKVTQKSRLTIGRFWTLIRYIVFILGYLFAVSSLQARDPRYHTYGEMVDEMFYVALNYPHITRLHIIGYTTVNQLPIWAIKISDNPAIQEDEPSILYNGVHHACELIGVEICLYMMWDLVTKYNVDPFITSAINSNEIWIVPMVNPDGHYIGSSGIDTLWRKNTRDNNNNGVFDAQDGVDLNRNYDFLWHLGNSNPSSREYRGPYPFSEAETQAIRNLTNQEKFVFDICYHSSREYGEGELVYYPWRWGNSFCPDRPHIKAVAESLAKRIRNDAGTGTYFAIYGNVAEGGVARNWFYYVGVISFTIEVSNGYFPPGYRIDSICQRNLAGAYYLLERMTGSQITGHIKDSITDEPLVAEVRILEAYAPPETIMPRMSDSMFGRFYRILNPGTYTVQVLKNGYQTKTIYNVNVSPGTPTYLDIRLNPTTAIKETFSKALKKYFKVIPSITHKNLEIHFSVEFPSDVDIKIYDNNGRLIRTLVNQRMDSGEHRVLWDKKDGWGNNVSEGIYFIKISIGLSTYTQKIIITN